MATALALENSGWKAWRIILPPTDLTRNVCPSHSRQRVPVSAWICSSPAQNPPWLPPDRVNAQVFTVACKILHDLTCHFPDLSSSHLLPTLDLLQSHWLPCCYLNTPGHCLRAFALAGWLPETLLQIVSWLPSLTSSFRSSHKYHILIAGPRLFNTATPLPAFLMSLSLCPHTT